MLTGTDEGYTLLRRETDEGPHTVNGQIADPFILAVDSSLYLYYGATTDGSATGGNYKIKLAIAPYTFSQIVQTTEGDGGIIGNKNSRWENDGKNIYFNAGNVGIGTSSPSQPIEVVDAVGGTKSIKISSTASNGFVNFSAVNNGSLTASFGITPSTYTTYGALTSNRAVMYNTATTVYMLDAGGTAHIWTTAGNAEKMRLDQNGALSIGSSANGHASSAVDITSTTKGLLLPRMTKAQRDAISSPTAGLAVYQTDNTPGLRVYNGTNWMRFTETAD
jgi:hypothetical protein